MIPRLWLRSYKDREAFRQPRIELKYADIRSPPPLLLVLWRRSARPRCVLVDAPLWYALSAGIASSKGWAIRAQDLMRELRWPRGPRPPHCVPPAQVLEISLQNDNFLFPRMLLLEAGMGGQGDVGGDRQCVEGGAKKTWARARRKLACTMCVSMRRATGSWRVLCV